MFRVEIDLRKALQFPPHPLRVREPPLRHRHGRSPSPGEPLYLLDHPGKMYSSSPGGRMTDVGVLRRPLSSLWLDRQEDIAAASVTARRGADALHDELTVRSEPLESGSFDCRNRRRRSSRCSRRLDPPAGRVVGPCSRRLLAQGRRNEGPAMRTPTPRRVPRTQAKPVAPASGDAWTGPKEARDLGPRDQ